MKKLLTLNALASTFDFWKKINSLASSYYDIDGLKVVTGNKKLGRDTLVLNMGSGTHCPSKKLGLCKVSKKCYALKAERLYPGCLPYRTEQEKYWLNTSAKQIIKTLDKLLNTKTRNKKPLLESIRYFRFNESGDFHNQNCVEKLEDIAEYLYIKYGIVTYGYTARKDLNYDCMGYTVLRCSGWNHSKFYKTIVINKNDVKETIETTRFFICPGDCKKCNVCKRHSTGDIAFIKH